MLLHRFAESVRDAKIAPASSILETSQPVDLACHSNPGAPPLVATFSSPTARPPRAAELKRVRFRPPRPTPGFLTVKQGDQTLLDAAVHFGDTREADFADCAAADTLAAASGASVERHTDEDHWWRLWFLLLLLVLLVSWHFTKERSNPATPQPATPQPT